MFARGERYGIVAQPYDHQSKSIFFVKNGFGVQPRAHWSLF